MYVRRERCHTEKNIPEVAIIKEIDVGVGTATKRADVVIDAHILRKLSIKLGTKVAL